MITTNLVVQPAVAVVSNPDYNGFLADIVTLNATTPQAQSPLGGGWTASGTLQRINGQYTQGFVQLFPFNWCIQASRGAIRLGFQGDWWG